jgi:hypothetical protein
MGFDMPLDGEPPIDMSALQSFKEPTGRPASFEDGPPSLGFVSSNPAKSEIF